MQQPAGSESTWFYDLLAWADTHRKQLIAGVVAFLGLVLIVYVMLWKREQTRLEASTALFRATTPPAGAQAATPDPDALLQVTEQYASTGEAERALLLAATSAYRKGDYAKAHDLFQRFLDEHPKSLLAPIASLGIATCLDAQDKMDEAAQAYETTIARYSDEPVANRARLALAALYEAQGKYQEALRVYDQMTDLAGFSPMAMEARQRREQLLEQHPELAPQPAEETAAPTTPAETAPTPGATNAAETSAAETNAPAAEATAGASPASTPAAATTPTPDQADTSAKPAAEPAAPATPAGDSAASGNSPQP